MIISLEEIKTYLRVDYEDDDLILQDLIDSAVEICEDIARTSSAQLESTRAFKIAVMYAVAYMYENKESIDYHTLTLSLRSLLAVKRKSVF